MYESKEFNYQKGQLTALLKKEYGIPYFKITYEYLSNGKISYQELYDYGFKDHDIISVYVDKKRVLLHKELTARPLFITLNMDGSSNYHEVLMVAENLGDLPPNTAMMKIKYGSKSMN